MIFVRFIWLVSHFWTMLSFSKLHVTKWIRNGFYRGIFVTIRLDSIEMCRAKRVVQFAGNSHSGTSNSSHIFCHTYLLNVEWRERKSRRRWVKKRLSQIETVYKSKLIETGDGGWGKMTTTETIPKNSSSKKKTRKRRRGQSEERQN